MEKPKFLKRTMSREASRVSNKSKTLRSNTVAINNENKRPEGGAVTGVVGKATRGGEKSRTVGVVSTVSKRTSTQLHKNGSKQRKEKRGNLNMVHQSGVNNHDEVDNEDDQFEDTEEFANEEEDNSVAGRNNEDDEKSKEDSSEEDSDDDEEEEIEDEEKEKEILPVIRATDGRHARQSIGT